MARAEAEAARLALAARGADPDRAGATLSVRAPRSGTLESLAVAAGEGVEAGEPLGRIRAAPRIGCGSSCRCPAPTLARGSRRPKCVPATAGVGRRESRGSRPRSTRETRRLTYRLRLEGGHPPLAGTPLEVRVPLALAIVLPQAALQQMEGTWGVFVREGAEARFQPVRRGAELGGDVLVLAGVEPGQTVATEGAYLLKSLYLKLCGGGEAHEH